MSTTQSNMTDVYIQPDMVEVMKEQTLAIVKAGTSLQINSAEEYVVLVQYVKDGKEAIRTLEKMLAEPTRKAFEAHRAMTKLAHELIDPIRAKIDEADLAATRWYAEQERIRLEKEAQLRREVEQQQKRAEEERQLKIEEARQQEIRKIEEEQLRAAEKADSFGDKELAEEILSQPIIVDDIQISVDPIPPPTPAIVEKSVPIISGRSYRKAKWTFEIVDPSAIPREFLEAGLLDMKSTDPRYRAIQNHVDAFGKAANIPGVRFVEGGLVPVTKK